jgi:hypothetical protein
MAVYVDWLMQHGWVIRGRHTKSCHMFADSVGEIRQFAEKIGLKRSWLQFERAIHFDLTPSKRAEAVRAGAVELTRETFREKYHQALEQGRVYRELRGLSKAQT